MLLTFKPGVKIEKVNARLLTGLGALAIIMGEETGADTIVITSMNDGVHKEGSFHYSGRAADIRSKTFAREAVQNTVDRFKLAWDKDYDLIWESKGLPNEHLHLEYDPR